MCVIGWISSVGYCWARGLRSTPSIVVSRHRRHSHVFFHRQSRQPGKHPGEVDAGSTPFLPKCSDHPCRQQERSSSGRGDQTRADEDETGAGKTGGRQGCRGKDQCICVPGMFGKNQGRCTTGVWDGHQSGASDEEKEKDRLPANLANTACSRVSSAQQTNDLVMPSAALSLFCEYHNPSVECRAIFVVFSVDIPVVLCVYIARWRWVVIETCLSLQECRSTSQILLNVWCQITNLSVAIRNVIKQC